MDHTICAFETSRRAGASSRVAARSAFAASATRAVRFCGFPWSQMCFRVTKTSGRGIPPDPRTTSVRPKESPPGQGSTPEGRTSAPCAVGPLGPGEPARRSFTVSAPELVESYRIGEPVRLNANFGDQDLAALSRSATEPRNRPRPSGRLQPRAQIAKTLRSAVHHRGSQTQRSDRTARSLATSARLPRSWSIPPA